MIAEVTQEEEISTDISQLVIILGCIVESCFVGLVSYKETKTNMIE